MASKTINKKAYLVYPFNKPKNLQQKIKRNFLWLKKRKVEIVDKHLQADTFYAVTVVSRAVKHLGSNFSRDYLIERIEHLDQSIAFSPIYPRLGLGPGQHFASKGAYIGEISPAKDKETKIKIISGWIVP